MNNCTACDLHKSGINTVCMSAKGSPSSGLFIVAERPNISEDSRKTPFSGQASRLLFDLIKRAGIGETDFYATYAAKCFYPDTAAKELKRNSIEICNDTWLKKEILTHKPAVVVAIGAETMSLFTDISGVMKNRGVFFDAEVGGHKFKFMPTLSPAYLLQNHRDLEPQVVMDFKRAFNAVKHGVVCWSEEKKAELNYRTIVSLGDFDEFIEEVRNKPQVAIDIESRGKDPYFDTFKSDGFGLVSIQFSTGPKTGWFLPIAHSSYILDQNPHGMAWTDSLWRTQILPKLKWLFESGDVFIIGHNFKFDSKWILSHLGIKPKLSFDTMLAHGLFGETSSGLKKLAWEMTDLGGYEEEQAKYTASLEPDKKYDMFNYPFEQLALYGCCDVDVTYRVFEVLDKKLSENEQMLNLFKILIKASRAFVDIEHEGIKIDTVYLQQLGIDLDLELKNLKEEFKQGAFEKIKEVEADLIKEATSEKSGKLLKHKPTEFNIDSSDHVSRLFYDKMGIEINDRHRSKKTNDPSVGKKALEELVSENPIAETLLKYRALSKQKVGFVDAYPRYTDFRSRIHPDYKLIKFYNEDADKEQGTATGRLACSDPNLQQVPSRDEDKRIKSLFIPDHPEHLLMDCDYSGIELRVTAMYCKDPVMKQFLNTGKGDFHRYVASKIYNKPEDQITKLQRTQAKSTTFGILYGAGPSKIAEQAKCSTREATAFIEEYFKLFPTLKKWITIQKAYAQKNLCVKSLFGRVRSLPDANSPNEGMREAALRRAVNTPIQSDASDITLYGLTRIASYLNKFPHTNKYAPSRLRASVHDSILLTVHKNDFEEIANHIKFNILEKPELDFLVSTGVKLQAEVSVGKNWGNQIELKTEE